MNTTIQDLFLQFVRLGVGASDEIPEVESVDWPPLEDLASAHGLTGVVIDGMETLPRELRPEKRVILQSIGRVLQNEQQFAVQRKTAEEMALLLHENGIRTYVLKGEVVSECYPRPEHRVSVDMDCFLRTETGDFNAWKLGNSLVRSNGFEVATDFYKNSTFYFPGLTVENHRFLTPFRGNKRLAALERLLQTLLREDKGEDGFDGTWLYRPPVMVSALFLIEHAFSHFLHEGLTWRHVLDWVMFSRRHRDEIDWKELDAQVDEFGFRRFYGTYVRLGRYLLGEVALDNLTATDLRMLADIWAPLDLHESVRGVRGKLALAGNTWRARWKYRMFTDMSWMRALWIQAKGVLFEKEPKL